MVRDFKMMDTYLFYKVQQTLGYREMASYAQQVYNVTFCLMHGCNLHSYKNSGVDQFCFLSKASISEVVSQPALTNVSVSTAHIMYDPMDSTFPGWFSLSPGGLRSQVP